VTVGRSTVLAAAVAALLGSLAVWIVSAVSPLMRDELGLTEQRLGLAVSVYFAVSALVSWLGGGLSDRVGARTTLLIGAATSVGAVVGIVAVAGTWVHVVLLLALAGVGSAIIQPATNHAIVRGVRLTRHGLALGLKQASVPAATTLAGVGVPLLAVTFGWRWALALPVAAALVFLALQGSLPDGRRPAARLADADRAGDGGVARSLAVVAVAGGVGVGAISAATAFLVPYLVWQGTSEGNAGWVLALASLAGVAMRVLNGWRADSLGTSSVPTIVALLALGALGGVGVALAPSTVWVALGAVLMVGAGWGWNGLLVLTIVRAFPDTPGLATGISQVGIRGGGALGPGAFGLLVATSGYGAAWLAVAVALGVAALLMLLGGRLLPDPAAGGGADGDAAAPSPSGPTTAHLETGTSANG
jgi:MFS family permease